MSAPGPRLENRLPAEGINASTEHPLKEFAWLVGSALVALALLMLSIGWAARWIAPRVPFAAEVALAARFPALAPPPPESPRARAAQAELQARVDRLREPLGVPSDMTLTVHYRDADLVNAYATLGGHLHVYRGLLQALRSEEALDALLAHEIAHVLHRDVAASLGRGLAVGVLLSTLSADAGAAAARAALGQTANVALLGYSREQETRADEAALDAAIARHGHAAGALALFEDLQAAQTQRGPALEILRSHPLTPDRLTHLKSRAQSRGAATVGTLRPLPAALQGLKPEA